jgi:phenylalanyl-tRNA synthetase beta chain
VDEYPLKAEDPTVEIATADVKRALGIELKPKEIATILESLEFAVEVKGKTIKATTPDHRLDIGADPVIGRADVMEEIARIYGYDTIPETRMADVLPPQRGNPSLEFEEKVRDILVNLDVQEIITYRMTNPEREERRLPPGVEPHKMPYVEIVNPIASDRYAMRKSLLSSVLEIIETNVRIRERIAIFEIGYIYLSSEDGPLPDELPRLVIAMTGKRGPTDWETSDQEVMDFYDLKGVCERLLEGLHIEGYGFQGHQAPSFHPGKCASIKLGETQVGFLGEIHPEVHARYDFGEAPALAASFDIQALMEASPRRHDTEPVSPYPPVLEDIALIVDDDLPAAQVEFLIRQTGGDTVSEVKLFDVYRGEQIGAGKKSLAYSLTYQAEDRTLTDEDVAKVRDKIVKRLEREINAKLRS